MGDRVRLDHLRSDPHAPCAGETVSDPARVAAALDARARALELGLSIVLFPDDVVRRRRTSLARLLTDVDPRVRGAIAALARERLEHLRDPRVRRLVEAVLDAATA